MPKWSRILVECVAISSLYICGRLNSNQPNARHFHDGDYGATCSSIYTVLFVKISTQCLPIVFIKLVRNNYIKNEQLTFYANVGSSYSLFLCMDRTIRISVGVLVLVIEPHIALSPWDQPYHFFFISD